jgi:type IV pilus assembly protein PilB
MASREYRSLRGPKRLGDRLLEAGLITRTQLDGALDQQQAGVAPRQRLGRTLVELGFLTDRDLTQMLSVHFAIPVAPFSIAEADERAIALVPARVARRRRALPLRIVGGSLLIAVADAAPPAMVDELQTVSGLPVLLYLASDVDLEGAWPKRYDDAVVTLPSRLRELAGKLEHLVDDDRHLRAELEHLCGEIDALVAKATATPQ